ncbi:MAG: (Fe-S)-binding protein, partial [Anaerolineaceae bacterium]|nr:(Fe-S)-binding protein [Anaerolineaceae bacterium]
CRACEQACPSGVQYGALMETTRIVLKKERPPDLIGCILHWLLLRQMLPHVGRLRFVAWWMRMYQVTGFQRLVRALNFFPRKLKNIETLLPHISKRRPDYRNVAPAIGQFQGKVAFFYGCIQDAFLAEINAATIRVLQRNGYEVHFPAQQTCCGAAQLHQGDDTLARGLARKNIDTFLDDEYEAVINNAGGCGATLKEYTHLLQDDPAYAEKAERFVSRVKDINEFLMEHLHVAPQGAINARVTYSDSCHLRHVQKVINQPRDLLRQIPGLELIELKSPDCCCGSAGVYNILQPDTANAVLDAKMADIASTGAEMIVITNTGCHLQLNAGVQRAGIGTRVIHLVELLDQSYKAEA